ncbi:hypothetical protein [Anaeroselena agilis]|uniref:Uncharacterized protein n=1 Tax=Anaeroselena agilis TaxID=3063788 RepID=A0ABU3NUZ6_9FIRM|nr:hypothetical protein [Selenomonadales bacterium 4137-cl]
MDFRGGRGQKGGIGGLAFSHHDHSANLGSLARSGGSSPHNGRYGRGYG